MRAVFTSLRSMLAFLSSGGLHGHRTCLGCGELEGKGGAAADFADDTDRAAELLDDLLADRETEAEPAPLRGDEVIEDLRQAIGGDAAARVRDDDARAIAGA